MERINYDGLIAHLSQSDGTFGLLTMQATSTTRRLHAAFPKRLKALYSAEHGFFGTLAAGEKADNAWHPIFNLPIHSLYGTCRKPTPEMLKGIDRMVIDLCDIGVRCYTYLATLKNTLEACAEQNIPVTVLDRPIPMGDILDGPPVDCGYSSFVAPINVPFCYGMTPGEAATWIRQTEKLDLDLDVIKLVGWSHQDHEPWPNFIPPSPAIRSWDNAVAYPMTVFTEAYPAVDCDRSGALAFRIIGAPWMNPLDVMKDLGPGLDACGVEMRPYRYQPNGGPYSSFTLNGVLFSVPRRTGYYPVTAGVLILAALLQRYGDKVTLKSRPEWMDKLFGTSDVAKALKSGDIDSLFRKWIDAQDAYVPTRVNLYSGVE